MIKQVFNRKATKPIHHINFIKVLPKMTKIERTRDLVWITAHKKGF